MKDKMPSNNPSDHGSVNSFTDQQPVRVYEGKTMKFKLNQIFHIPAIAIAVAVIITAAGGPSAWAQGHNEVITKTGTFTEDVVVRGEEVSIKADIDGGIIAMGGEVDIQSTVSGDVVGMAGSLDVGEKISGDVFAAGGDINLFGTVGGEVTATGGNVDMKAAVKGNALIMGGNVDAENQISGDLKMLGGNVESTATVAGNAWLAGGRVELDEEARVEGNAWLAGSRVDVAGWVGGNLRAAGRKVEISGEVKGDVHIDGIEVKISPTAVIHGNLTYRAPEQAKIHPDAKISGDVTFIQSASPTNAVGVVFAAIGSGLVITLVAFIVLGAVQTLVFPEFSLAVSRLGLTEPWKALGVGIGAVILTPFVIALLVPTLIGLPLAVVLGSFYIILLALGFVTTALIVGRKGLTLLGKNWDSSAWGRTGLIAIGLLIVTVFAIIPFLGALVIFGTLSLGAGSLILQITRRRSGTTGALGSQQPAE